MARREGLRERIRESAIALARQQTFAGTTIDDIAHSLEVSKAAVYYHFRAKEQLLADLVAPLLDRLEELVEQAAEPGGPLGHPRALLRAYLDVLVEHRDVVPLVVQDVSVINHPVLGGRPDELDRKLRETLASAVPGAAAEARATAALAALRRPVLVLPVSDVRRFRRALLAAAGAALGLPRGRGSGGTAPDGEVAGAGGAADDAADDAPTTQATTSFSPSPANVGPARTFARAVLTDWAVGDDVVDTAALVMSEMVAYALASGDPDADVDVRMVRTGTAVRIEMVKDDTADVPQFSSPDVRARTVPLVDLLATAWGIERRRGERVRVWAELAIA